MPIMKGIEVLEIMKEKGIKIPVIILTGDIQNSSLGECMKLGAKEYLQKPAKFNELEDCFKKYLA